MGKSGKGKSLKAKDVTSGDAIATAHSADSKGKASATCDIGKKSSSGCCVKLIFFYSTGGLLRCSYRNIY